MLKLEISSAEVFVEEDQSFTTIKGVVLTLEHSLVSLSKWESNWCVPFLSKEEKTPQQSIDYIKCMTLTQNVDEVLYSFLTEDNLESIRAYIDHPKTATTIHDMSTRTNREVVTSELIYYWMTVFNIPFDVCQKWHLNRLLMLINVCSIKQEKPQNL